MRTAPDPVTDAPRTAVAGLSEVRVRRVETAVHAALVVLLLVVVCLRMAGLEVSNAAEAELAVLLLAAALLMAGWFGPAGSRGRVGN